MTRPAQAGSARERLIETASRQFYDLGYRGVGIDQIIKESAIAKATFYAHFASKESLYVEVLKKQSDESITHMRGFAENRTNPLDRLLAPIDFLLHWLPSTDFRGCPFINMTSEIYNRSSEARIVGKNHYARIKKMISDYATALAQGNENTYAHVGKDSFANQYMVIFTGAISLSSINTDESAIHSAKELLLKIIN